MQCAKVIELHFACGIEFHTENGLFEDCVDLCNIWVVGESKPLRRVCRFFLPILKTSKNAKSTNSTKSPNFVEFRDFGYFYVFTMVIFPCSRRLIAVLRVPRLSITAPLQDDALQTTSTTVLNLMWRARVQRAQALFTSATLHQVEMINSFFFSFLFLPFQVSDPRRPWLRGSSRDTTLLKPSGGKDSFPSDNPSSV